jgi:polysaccharide biosynthesis protein PslH
MNLSKECKPKLVVVLSRFPFPLEKGDKLRAYYQLRDLSVKFEIYLICTSQIKIKEVHLKEIGKFCKKVYVFKLNKILVLSSVFFGFFGNKPLQVAFFHQNWIQRKINNIIAAVEPNHIFCQLIRMTEYVKNYHACSKTLDYMDALSKGMERRAAKTRRPLKWLFLLEFRRLLSYERQIFDYFEKHIIISERDQYEISHPQNNSMIVIPNGVDERFYQKIDIEKDFDVLFTGNMSYSPNIEAAKILANKIIPTFNKQKSYQINCLISGANPHFSLKKIILRIYSNNWLG